MERIYMRVQEETLEKVIYVDDLIEEMADIVEELSLLAMDYFYLSYPKLTEGIHHFSGEKGKRQQRILDKMARYIRILGKIVGKIEKIKNSDKKLKFKNIDNANKYLIKLSRVGKALMEIYNSMRGEDETIDSYYKLLKESEKSFDFFVEWYNDTHKEKLYTYGNALGEYNSNKSGD